MTLSFQGRRYGTAVFPLQRPPEASLHRPPASPVNGTAADALFPTASRPRSSVGSPSRPAAVAGGAAVGRAFSCIRWCWWPSGGRSIRRRAPLFLQIFGRSDRPGRTCARPRCPRRLRPGLLCTCRNRAPTGFLHPAAACGRSRLDRWPTISPAFCRRSTPVFQSFPPDGGSTISSLVTSGRSSAGLWPALSLAPRGSRYAAGRLPAVTPQARSRYVPRIRRSTPSASEHRSRRIPFFSSAVPSSPNPKTTPGLQSPVIADPPVSADSTGGSARGRT